MTTATKPRAARRTKPKPAGVGTALAPYFDVTETEVLVLRDKYATRSFDTPANYEMGRIALFELRTLRVAIDKRREQLKKPHLTEGRKIDAAAKVLTGIIEAVETPLLQLKKAEDERAAAAKLAAERAEIEAERLKMEAEQKVREEEFAEFRAEQTAEIAAGHKELEEKRRAFDAAQGKGPDVPPPPPPSPVVLRGTPPYHALLRVYVKEIRGDQAVVFIDSEIEGLQHYPVTIKAAALLPLPN